MNTDVIERARRYLAKIPGAVSGSSGRNATFHVACVLVNGFGLSTSEALPLFIEWNPSCQPQWSEAELRRKLRDAEKASHRRPRGYLLAHDKRPTTYRPATLGSAVKPGPRPLPDRSGFGPGTEEQIRQLAKMRPYHAAGLRWANERGLLVFGQWNRHQCHGLTDESGRVLELRRMDGQPFPAIPGTDIDERKSHAVKHSAKAWPVGIRETRKFPAIALVEGLPDFLTAHYVTLCTQRDLCKHRNVRCAPVAMLSSSPAIHEDALPYFKGKVVRIFPHADTAGLVGARKWQAQLQTAGAVGVDIADFSPYQKGDGSPVNDLWEFAFRLCAEDMDKPETWEVMP